MSPVLAVSTRIPMRDDHKLNPVSRRRILRQLGESSNQPPSSDESPFSALSRRTFLRGAVGSLAATVGGLLGIGWSADTARAQPETDPCTRPAPNPEPGTAAWYARDRLNAYCATQGTRDFASNPVIEAAHTEATEGGGRGRDAGRAACEHSPRLRPGEPRGLRTVRSVRLADDHLLHTRLVR